MPTSLKPFSLPKAVGQRPDYWIDQIIGSAITRPNQTLLLITDQIITTPH